MIALALLVAQAAEPTRQEQVLELVERIQPRWGGFHGVSRFFARPAPLGAGVVHEPSFPVGCGSLDEGTIDDAAARSFACELFAIYGLEVRRNEPLRDGAHSVALDAVAYPSRLGFELRGDGEDPDAALDGPELAWLEGRGFQLHVADVAVFRRRFGDEFTATLAWLAGIVSFLDATTEGEDVALGGLLFEREGTWTWPVDEAVADAQGARVNERHGDWVELTVERTTTLTFAAPGDGWGPPIQRFLDGPRSVEALSGSTRGAPSVVHFLVAPHPPAPGEPEPAVRVRIRQGGHVRSSATTVAYLTGAFDLAEPFQVELELTRGRYLLQGPARLGAARRE